MSHSRHSERGFSLVEVLCALTITAMAIVPLYRGLGQSQSAALYLETHLGARLLAETILEDERMQVATQPGLRKGKSGRYAWQITIEPAVLKSISGLPTPYRLFRLSAEITWGARGRFQIDTMKLGI
jgi:prepilin-type N-terminal cleavage/methylation domain-containing protein